MQNDNAVDPKESEKTVLNSEFVLQKETRNSLINLCEKLSVLSKNETSLLDYKPTLSNDLQIKAKEELNEVPEVIPACLIKLERMIFDESHLKCPTNAEFLLRFLRARKYDVNKAFTMIKRYYQVRKENEDLFGNLKPSSYKHLLTMDAQIMLPQKNWDGSRVFVFRLDKCDMKNAPVCDIFKTNLMSMELISMEEETQVSGVTVIVDLCAFSMQKHLVLLSPYFAKHSIEVIQESFPLRFRSFHVLNEPFYIDAIYSAIKPFMKSKLKNRVHFHGSDLNSLHKYLKKEILPEVYGGSQAVFTNQWYKELLSYEDVLIDIQNYGYVGSVS